MQRGVVTTTNGECKQGALLGRRSIHRITSAKAPAAWLAVEFSAGVSCEVQASFCVVIGIASAAATPSRGQKLAAAAVPYGVQG